MDSKPVQWLTYREDSMLHAPRMVLPETSAKDSGPPEMIGIVGASGCKEGGRLGPRRRRGIKMVLRMNVDL